MAKINSDFDDILSSFSNNELSDAEIGILMQRYCLDENQPSDKGQLIKLFEKRSTLLLATLKKVAASHLANQHPAPSKRLKLAESTVKETWTLNPIDSTLNKFVVFPKEMNEMVGMITDEHFELFMRQDNVRMGVEFSDFYGSKKTFLIVQGPPGVGKTKQAALFVVSSLQQNRVHAWIRLEKGSCGVHKVYVLEKGAEDNEVNCTQVLVVSSGELVRVLLDVKCTLVVFANCNKENMKLVNSCREIGHQCKVIAVSSLRVKPDASDSTERIMEVNGWQLQEYLDACKNDAFYNLVKANLRTDGYTEEELDNLELRSEIVEAKYFLAGGSARWMFECSAAELLEPIGTSPRSIMHHVRQVSRAEVEKGFRGDRSVSAVNHLLSRFNGAFQIVSKYVAALLLKKYDTDLLLNVMGHHPAVDGVMMKLDFSGRLGLGTQAEPKQGCGGFAVQTR